MGFSKGEEDREFLKRCQGKFDPSGVVKQTGILIIEPMGFTHGY